MFKEEGKIMWGEKYYRCKYKAKGVEELLKEDLWMEKRGYESGRCNHRRCRGQIK